MINYCLILSPLFWDCPHPRAFTLHLMIHTGWGDHLIYVDNLCSPATDLEWYFFSKEVSFFPVQLILLVLSWLADWFCQLLAPSLMYTYIHTLWVGFQNSSGQRGQLPICRLYKWGTEGSCLDLFQSENFLLGIIQLWYPNRNQLFLPSFLPSFSLILQSSTLAASSWHPKTISQL
jgi:hypothetical protein